jgi:hypothetical protein
MPVCLREGGYCGGLFLFANLPQDQWQKSNKVDARGPKKGKSQDSHDQAFSHESHF